MTGESDVQAGIRLALGTDPYTRLWRNHRGRAWFGKVAMQGGGRVVLDNARSLECGLAPGASDLIGIRRVVITADMVGTTVGIFTALEVKSATGRTSEDQTKFLQCVRRFGGRGGVVRSSDDAIAVVRGVIA